MSDGRDGEQLRGDQGHRPGAAERHGRHDLGISVWFKTTATSGVLLGDSSVLPGTNPCPFLCAAAVAVPLLWIGSNGALNGLGSIGKASQSGNPTPPPR